jgi:hypothetical protein
MPQWKKQDTHFISEIKRLLWDKQVLGGDGSGSISIVVLGVEYVVANANPCET